MSEDGSDADLKSPTNATPDDRVTFSVSGEDREFLRILQEAGRLDVDGLEPSEPDPQLTEWTLEEFYRYLATEAGKGGLATSSMPGRPSTAECYRNGIDFLEDPPSDAVPAVDLRPPSRESWLDHVFARKQNGADGTALNNHRKALKHFLRFLGLDVWDVLDDPYDEADPEWDLPPDELVPEFWLRDLCDDDYLAATFAHIFHFGFNVGVRPPSEIWALDVDDVDFRARSIVITEVKKGGNRRTVKDVAPYIVTAPNSKSLRNYYENVRPQVDTGDSDAFFLNKDGERFGPNYLGQRLGELGRKVWRKFKPYTMRRFFATTFLVENDLNVYATAKRLGDTVQTVERRYIDEAKALARSSERFGMKRLRREVSE